MYREELDSFLRALPGINAKELKSRISYWRANGTRFCKLEGKASNSTIVFTDLHYTTAHHLLAESESDHEGRLKLRLINARRVESAKALILKRYR